MSIWMSKYKKDYKTCILAYDTDDPMISLKDHAS